MIGRHMPCESDGRTLMLRAFADGPPDDGMLQDRLYTQIRLCPRGEVWATEDGRVCLCDAAFDSEAWAKATVRLSDELSRLRKVVK